MLQGHRVRDRPPDGTPWPGTLTWSSAGPKGRTGAGTRLGTMGRNSLAPIPATRIRLEGKADNLLYWADRAPPAEWVADRRAPRRENLRVGMGLRQKKKDRSTPGYRNHRSLFFQPGLLTSCPGPNHAAFGAMGHSGYHEFCHGFLLWARYDSYLLGTYDTGDCQVLSTSKAAFLKARGYEP